MTPAEAIGFVVRDSRNSKKLAQSEVGRRMGSPRTYVSKVENGAAAPTIESLIRLAQALDTTGSALLAKAERFADGVNHGEIVVNVIRASGRPNEVVVLPKSAVDPAAIARRRKLAMALGTLPMEAA